MTASAVGTVALWAAIAASLFAMAPARGGRGRRTSLALGAVMSLVSTTVLATALLTNDFSLGYVAETTSRATPWPYRLAAVWGGMDGSMLFYSALTLAISAAVLKTRIAISVAGLIGGGYLLLTALVANPFRVLDIPAIDGRGLLAILQHPAMIYHPPILYFGLTVLIVPFAITVQAVARREFTGNWLKITRRWLLVAWTLLTFGMVAGASWAYVELGWGGFWAWDPVENTALMPWLAITVFLHTVRIQERDGRLRRWNALFAMLPFALTILGVYLTRSGVTGSIHSFAENPVIGATLLSAAVAALIVSGVMALRAHAGEAWERIRFGRDTWLVVSAGLLCSALVFVTVGTAYPAYASVFFGESIGIDSRFFVATAAPIALAIGVLSSFALETSWSAIRVPIRLVATWLVAGIAVGAFLRATSRFEPIPLTLASAGGAGAAVLAWRIARRRPKQRALVSHLAHLGFSLVLVGAGGSALGGEFRGTMSVGDTIEVAGWTVELDEVTTGEADRFIFARAQFTVDEDRRLSPEIRAYEDQTQPVSEPDLLSAPGADVIIAISQLAPDAKSVSVSVFVRPLVWWVWAGALTLGLAGLVGLFARGGDASPQRRPARAKPQQGETTTGIAVR